MSNTPPNEDIELLDAIDMHATIESNGVSIHMDGDRDADMWIEGPESGGEVHDGGVYRIELTGGQNDVFTEVGFFIPCEVLHDALESTSD